MRKPIILDNQLVGSVKQMSIYRVSDAPPDWAEEDPTQPDYIKNKPKLIAGDNIVLTKLGNTIIISAKNGAVNPDEPDTPDEPDIPEEPDIPVEPDNPSEEGTIAHTIISNEIPVYLVHDGVEEKVPFKLLSINAEHTAEGFYIVSDNDTIEKAGYQITFYASETGQPQELLMLKDAHIIETYQYIPNFGQWLAKGFDETYWVASGEVTKIINNEEMTYTKYVFNSELWGDPIRGTEYWRFEMEV